MSDEWPARVLNARRFRVGLHQGFIEECPVGLTYGGSPVIVWGLTPDAVTGSDVIEDGLAKPATLANNAYFLELGAETTNSSVDGLDVIFRDG